MKHRAHPCRLAPHIRAVVDYLARLGAEVVDTRPGRRVLIAFRVAGRKFSILVSAVLPKGADVGRYAAKECERVRALCAGHARAVSC